MSSLSSMIGPFQAEHGARPSLRSATASAVAVIALEPGVSTEAY